MLEDGYSFKDEVGESWTGTDKYDDTFIIYYRAMFSWNYSHTLNNDDQTAGTSTCMLVVFT